MEHVKLFENWVKDIFQKRETGEIEKAVEEIEKYNFERLFYQPGEGQVLRKDIIDSKLEDAVKGMPTVAKLLPDLFEVKGDLFSNATLKISGRVYRGVIPSSFELIRGEGDSITNDNSRKIISKLIKNSIA